MRFSMNGFRQQLSNDVKELKDIVESIVSGSFYENEELVSAANDLIRHSNVINCVYDNENPDFSEMSDIEVDHIELD